MATSGKLEGHETSHRLAEVATNEASRAPVASCWFGATSLNTVTRDWESGLCASGGYSLFHHFPITTIVL